LPPSTSRFDFSSEVIAWQKSFGRHDLPWHHTRDPYVIWLSEIMLQQTQVATVIPYFQRFIERFPDVAALANAEEHAVLALWSGLGYYARARNLHRAARRILDRHDSKFPETFAEVVDLPGVGRSTAGAICVFAFGQPHPILDGNVKRVFARHFAVHGFPGERAVEDKMWHLADSLLPITEIGPYTQGLMDLGARVCVRSRPKCGDCPLSDSCIARREDLVHRLPTPRPRKPLPHRRTKMLILWDGNDVLLERRPSAGIWGGLWCFPESERATYEWNSLCRKRYAVDCAEALRLDDLEHGFTHFKLTIEPYLLRVLGKLDCVTEPGVLWLSVEEAKKAALPAPVRSILNALAIHRLRIEQLVNEGKPRKVTARAK